MQIIDKLPAVIFEYVVFPDGKGDFTYISPRCQEVLGLNPEVLLSGVFQIKHFIYPRDWETFLRSFENRIPTLSEWKWEGRIQYRDEIKWIEAVGVPTSRDDGKVVWSGIITDITRRRELERRQREAETSYRNLLEQLPLGVGIHKDGKLIYAGRAGTGMNNAELERVWRRLQPLATDRMPLDIPPPRGSRFARTPGPSSSWWLPTRRCCRTRPSVSRGAPPWDLREPGPRPVTGPATSSSHFPPPIRAPPRPEGRRVLRC